MIGANEKPVNIFHGITYNWLSPELSSKLCNGATVKLLIPQEFERKFSPLEISGLQFSCPEIPGFIKITNG